MGRLGLVSAVVGCLSLGAIVVGCGDDDDAANGAGSGEGCITDVECKGDRICEDHECVDPEDADDRDGSSSGRGGSGSSGASAGSTSDRDGGTAGTRAGSGGRGGSSGAGSGGSKVIDDPELERACGLNCEARTEAACEQNVGSLDQCLAQCLVADEATRGYCLDEQTAVFACQASGGYACVSGYPQPKATCAVEALALSKCSQMTPCRDFCARAAGDCAPEGDACVTSCMEEQNSFGDATCGFYYTRLLACWGQKLTCEDGKPAIGECQAEGAEIAECIARRNHECDGYCWAAESLGCGADDCVTTCKAKSDESSCGTYYRRMIECTYRSRMFALTCEAGTPTPDPMTCSSEIQQYDSCMMR